MSGNIAILVNLIGKDDALRLARSCPILDGKRILYIPVRFKNAQRIARIIGKEKMKTLHDAMAGSQITLGNPDSWERKQRAIAMMGDPSIPITRISAITGTPRSFLYRHWV